MPKTKTLFVCQSCGFESSKWAGKCPGCGEWNSLVETVVSARKSKPRKSPKHPKLQPQSLSEIKVSASERLQTGIGEFDRVIGGGIVPGSVILLAGEPGIGKSTLLLQVAAGRSQPTPTLYISGEESPAQIKLRADRLGINSQNLQILPETDVDLISEAVRQLVSKSAKRQTVQLSNCQAAQLIIIDSIQTLTTDDLASPAGSIGQVRECARRLSLWAKEAGQPLILVGHVTKTGAVAGPKVLEHLVDTVLYLEGDRFRQFRLLRTFKNRFGPTNEVGVFKMGERGMEEVKNPSDMFLAERRKDAPGSVVTVVMEGTRPMLLEVQALTSKTSFSMPRRTASGFPYHRLLLITAVLEKHLKFNLQSYDLYVNIAGGVKVTEPAADLGVALAIASSFKNKVVDPKVAVFGEVGLSGELRSVAQPERRLQEAKSLGFKKIIYPGNARTLSEVLSKIFI